MSKVTQIAVLQKARRCLQEARHLDAGAVGEQERYRQCISSQEPGLSIGAAGETQCTMSEAM